MGIQYADIIFFAIVAVYVGLKLYSNLGKRTERDEDLVSRLGSHATAEAERLAAKKPAIEKLDIDNKKELEVISQPKIDFINQDVEKGINQISAADAGFSAVSFLNGAKTAFEMVVEGFAKKDKATLQSLLSNDIYIDFSRMIDEMSARGHSQQTNIVSISKETIIHAELAGSVAKIKVSFLSEQISVTKDAEGNIVEGDASRIVEVEDEWQFERDVTSASPNWEITAV